MIAAVILAAGHGRRFGGDKLLADLQGRPVLRWVIDAVCPASDSTLVVVPALDHPLAVLARGAGAVPVANGARDEGMASSIRAGVAALPDACEGVVVALGDQPLVRAETVHALRSRYGAGGCDAVAVRYADGRGHPVLFARALFPELLALHGDEGARRLLDALGERLATVAVEGDAPADVDTAEALARLRSAPSAG